MAASSTGRYQPVLISNGRLPPGVCVLNYANTSRFFVKMGAVE